MGLYPCPFCGLEQEINECDTARNVAGEEVIVCQRCDGHF